MGHVGIEFHTGRSFVHPRRALKSAGFRFVAVGMLAVTAACAFAGSPPGSAGSDPGPGRGSTGGLQSGPLSVTISPSPLQFTAPAQTATLALVEVTPPSGTVFSLNAADCTDKNVLSVVTVDAQHYDLTSATTASRPCTLIASDGINVVDVPVNPTTVGRKFTLPTPAPQPSLGSSKIAHVVIVVQENRSFDNLFNGYHGADSAQSGNNAGTQLALQPVDLGNPVSPGHYHRNWYLDYDGGKLDAFAQSNLSNPLLPYSYVPQSEIVPYWTLAQSYALADRFFQTNTGPSFVAHLFLIAGQALNLTDVPALNHAATSGPWGCDAPAGVEVPVLGLNGTTQPGPFPCFDFPTLGDELDARGLPWRYYTPPAGVPGGGVWSEYDAIRHIRFGGDWAADVVSPETNILTDVSGTSGSLAAVTWVVPRWQNSDHPGSGNTGPQWVASVVNAIGSSSFWNSTAIFIVWDDWGGWYDHVVPPHVDNQGLGLRVPLLVVSPYAKHGYVSHVVHEFGSILRFTEENFGLPPMAPSDARADDLTDCFDFAQQPQPYTPIPTVRHRPEDFQNAPRGPLGAEAEY